VIRDAPSMSGVDYREAEIARGLVTIEAMNRTQVLPPARLELLALRRWSALGHPASWGRHGYHPHDVHAR